MQPRGTNARTTLRRRPGFTLVELLVVVSIIALLISILLPSLKSARDQAKTVACMSQQAGLGRGGATYQSDWNGWIPGSPGTSGSVLLGYPTAAPGDSHDTPSERIQLWDWATPLGIWKSYAKARGDRWNVVAKKLLCPSNQYLSEPWYLGAIGPRPGWPIQPTTSYNTQRIYMIWPHSRAAPEADITVNPWGDRPPFIEASAKGANIGGRDKWTVGQAYAPRVEKVGNPTYHVFISDGERFTDPTTGRIDHDIDWRANAGGGFSEGGPTLPYTIMRSFFSSKDPVRRRFAPITYRHKRSKNLGLIVCYFDGRAEYMTESQSRWPDPWWPKGSEIDLSDFNTETQILTEPYAGGPSGSLYIVRK